MSYKQIDMETYPRKAHFEHFRTQAYPYVGITADVDVTEVLDWCRAHNRSFYLTFMHIAALAADEIPEFRRRIHDGGIVEYSECPTSHVEPMDDDTYRYCKLEHHMPLDKYFEKAAEAQEECRRRMDLLAEEDEESMYFISAVPWLHYTALLQPVAGGDESNPRITWGRYEKNHEGKMMMPLTVLAHHSLMDGIHIARFFENVKQGMKYLQETDN